MDIKMICLVNTVNQNHEICWRLGHKKIISKVAGNIKASVDPANDPINDNNKSNRGIKTAAASGNIKDNLNFHNGIRLLWWWSSKW